MKTLIDWSKEGGQHFGYSRERVAYLLETMHNASTGRETVSDVDTLTAELLRMLEVARRIDADPKTNLETKLELFLAEAGGEEYFRSIIDTVGCAGALHDVANAIGTVAMERDTEILRY